MNDTAPLGDSTPLCVDLDGTLCRTDTLCACALALATSNPLAIALLPFWLLRGRANFKARLAAAAALDARLLPYNSAFVEFLRNERSRGRSIWLVTATDSRIATPVAAHVGLFDGVLSSDGVRNLKGREKLRALSERFPDGFDYAGNSWADLPVWRGARHAIIVAAPKRLVRRAQREARVLRVF
jgi:phosphoserine phosphatase